MLNYTNHILAVVHLQILWLIRIPIKSKMCLGLLHFITSYHCWWCWRSIAALVETCSISTEEAGGPWGPRQEADSGMLSSVKTEKAIKNISDHKWAHRHTGGELKHIVGSEDTDLFVRTAAVKRSKNKKKKRKKKTGPLKKRLHKRCSKNVQHSARVQWGSHFLKHFTTSDQWHHSRAGWAAPLLHKEQQSGSAVGLRPRAPTHSPRTQESM